MRGLIIKEIELQDEREKILSEFKGTGRDKTRVIYDAIDEIYFLMATAKLHAIMISFFLAMVFVSWDIAYHSDDFSIFTGGTIFILAIVMIFCYKIAHEIVMEYFTGRKIEKAYKDILSEVRKDIELREILHFIRMRSVPRDRHFGTLILQRFIKED